jgi:hypothetical protein
MFIVENSSRSIHPYIISACNWSINVNNPYELGGRVDFSMLLGMIFPSCHAMRPSRDDAKSSVRFAARWGINTNGIGGALYQQSTEMDVVSSRTYRYLWCMMLGFYATSQ